MEYNRSALLLFPLNATSRTVRSHVTYCVQIGTSRADSVLTDFSPRQWTFDTYGHQAPNSCYAPLSFLTSERRSIRNEKTSPSRFHRNARQRTSDPKYYILSFRQKHKQVSVITELLQGNFKYKPLHMPLNMPLKVNWCSNPISIVILTHADKDV